MDIYLPADFHELLDAAPEDWREISISSAMHERAPASNTRHADPANECADPSWQTL